MTEIIEQPKYEFDYNNTKAWYIVHTRSRQEEAVKERLEKRRESMGLDDELLKVVIPYDTSIEIRKDKPVEIKKKLYPGYVFVEMLMTDRAWYVVRNTKDVSGFIGSSGGGAKPTPVKDIDILKILRTSGEELSEDLNFQEGDEVIILSGPFQGVKSKITSTREKDKIAVIDVEMFGRKTRTEIEYKDIQKIEEVEDANQ